MKIDVWWQNEGIHVELIDTGKKYTAHDPQQELWWGFLNFVEDVKRLST